MDQIKLLSTLVAYYGEQGMLYEPFVGKPVFWVFDQWVTLKPIFLLATEASQNIEILDVSHIVLILSRKLIRLYECAGCSAPVLFAYKNNRFACKMADILFYIYHSC